MNVYCVESIKMTPKNLLVFIAVIQISPKKLDKNSLDSIDSSRVQCWFITDQQWNMIRYFVSIWLTTVTIQCFFVFSTDTIEIWNGKETHTLYGKERRKKNTDDRNRLLSFPNEIDQLYEFGVCMLLALTAQYHRDSRPKSKIEKLLDSYHEFS